MALLSQINPIDSLTYYILDTHCNNIVISKPMNSKWILRHSTWHMTIQSFLSNKYIDIIKFLIM